MVHTYFYGLSTVLAAISRCINNEHARFDKYIKGSRFVRISFR